MHNWKDLIRQRLAEAPLDSRREEDVIEELSQCMEECYQEARAQGLSEAEAVSQILGELGAGGELGREIRQAMRPPMPGRIKNITQITESQITLGQKGATMLADLLLDLRYGVRMLLKYPTFSLIAIITLAIGVGANTAIFSVVNSTLLRPLPYAAPERLLLVFETVKTAGDRPNFVAPANFLDWQTQNRSFEQMVFYSTYPINISGDGEPEKVMVLSGTENLTKLMGRAPLLGRGFGPDDFQSGNDNGVILSYGFWQRHFGGGRGVVGKTFIMDGKTPLVVIGVMPSDFSFPSATIDFWAPLVMTDDTRATREVHYGKVIGRLKAGVTPNQAEQDIRSVAARLTEIYPKANEIVGATTRPLQEQMVGYLRPTLLIFFSATCLVLLIACGNIASLLLARASARQKEIAIRTAIGAGRRRIIQQLVTESLLLAILGGSLGLALAIWGAKILVSAATQYFPNLGGAAIDGWVLGFTLISSVLAGLVFGLVPAIQASKPNLTEALKEGSFDLTLGKGGRLRSLLVIGEVALATVVLIASGLVINSYWRLTNVNPGFRTDNLLAIETVPLFGKYDLGPKLSDFFNQATERIEALPGVRAVAFASAPPPKLGDNPWMLFFAEQSGEPTKTRAIVNSVDNKYLDVMGMPLLKGRNFTKQDLPGATGVVIINQAFAKQSWPNQDPIGRHLKMGVIANPWLTVVGLVGDTHMDLQDRPRPVIHMLYSQSNGAFPPSYLIIQTASDPETLISAVRNEIWAVDKDQPVGNIKLMSDLVSDTIARQRFNMLLLATFGVLALGLASIGIYGLFSYTVAQNTRDIGIRMALGAQSRNILGMIVRRGLVLALAGVAVGILVSLMLTRAIKSLLFGVESTDPLTFVGVSLVLAIIAVAACYIPARRATRVDPMLALRAE